MRLGALRHDPRLLGPWYSGRIPAVSPGDRRGGGLANIMAEDLGRRQAYRVRRMCRCRSRRHLLALAEQETQLNKLVSRLMSGFEARSGNSSGNRRWSRALAVWYGSQLEAGSGYVVWD